MSNTPTREASGSIRILSGGLAVASLGGATAPLPTSLANRLAQAGTKEEDLLYLSFPLVHEGPNGNGDVFTKDEMLAAYATLVGTPIDLDHSQGVRDIVGMHYDSKYIEENGQGVIYCSGYVYAHLYPDIAVKLLDGAITGVSMETRFAWAERRGEFRVLHDLEFIGSGLVRTPADKKARVKVQDDRSTADLNQKRKAAAAAVVMAALSQGDRS